ncbi:MAG: energy transducer TonB [Proteobacteria bacterium]|nr:energy transducer TonB [Pseudomonadota bacterium]
MNRGPAISGNELLRDKPLVSIIVDYRSEMNESIFSEVKIIPGNRSVWMKYIAIALAIHASVLCIPLSKRVPETANERAIDVIVMSPEAAPPPMLSFTSKRLPGAPGPEKSAPMPGKKTSIPGLTKPGEMEKKKEPGPAGPGNVADEQVIAQAVDSHGQADGKGVAVAGLNLGGDKIGFGSGGTGTGTGSGGGGGGGEGGPWSGRFGTADGPRFLHHEIPEYPFSARKRGKEGKVVVIVTIDEKGKLIKSEVVEATDKIFVQPVMEALKRSTFLPAKRNGVPIACRAALPVLFAMQD